MPGRARHLVVRLLARTVYRRLVIWTAAEVPPGLPGLQPGYTAGELGPADAGAYRALRPDTGAEEYRQRFRDGHRCFVLRHGDEIVEARWVAMRTAWIPYLGGTFHLEPEECYWHDHFVAPARRREGLSLMATRAIAETLSAERVRALGLVLPENAAGMRMMEKLGGRRIGTAHSLGAGRRRLIFRTSRPA